MTTRTCPAARWRTTSPARLSVLATRCVRRLTPAVSPGRLQNTYLLNKIQNPLSLRARVDSTTIMGRKSARLRPPGSHQPRTPSGPGNATRTQTSFSTPSGSSCAAKPGATGTPTLRRPGACGSPRTTFLRRHQAVSKIAGNDTVADHRLIQHGVTGHRATGHRSITPAPRRVAPGRWTPAAR